MKVKFDEESFILDYFSVDWEDLLKIDELKVDIQFNPNVFRLGSKACKTPQKFLMVKLL